MKNLVAQYKNYCIYNVGKEYLYDVVKFVIKENYKHHQGCENVINFDEEIKFIYDEELSFADASQIYIAEDINHKMIGCIRVFRWNKKNTFANSKNFQSKSIELYKRNLNTKIIEVNGTLEQRLDKIVKALNLNMITTIDDAITKAQEIRTNKFDAVKLENGSSKVINFIKQSAAMY